MMCPGACEQQGERSTSEKTLVCDPARSSTLIVGTSREKDRRPCNSASSAGYLLTVHQEHDARATVLNRPPGLDASWIRLMSITVNCGNGLDVVGLLMHSELHL